jgi:hypothetical protein
MNWILRRIIVIWLVMCVLCIAAIALGHLDHTPNALQRLGFDVCEGNPCYRGVKLGMSYAKVLKLIGENATNVNDFEFVGLHYSSDQLTVDRISSRTYDRGARLPFRLGDIFVVYGAPNRVYFELSDGEGNFVLIYDDMVVETSSKFENPSNSASFRIWLDSSIVTLSIDGEIENGFIWYQEIPDTDPWRGFTSAQIYRERSLRDIGATPTP